MMMYIMKHEKPQILHRIACEVAGQLPDAIQSEELDTTDTTAADELDTVTEEERKQAMREYWREYREKNREKLKESQKRYRETHRKAIRKYNAEWRAKNPDKVKAKNERYWKRKALASRNNETPED